MYMHIQYVIYAGIEVEYAGQLDGFPPGKMVIRCLLLLWTGDYPAQHLKRFHWQLSQESNESNTSKTTLFLENSSSFPHTHYKEETIKRFYHSSLHGWNSTSGLFTVLHRKVGTANFVYCFHHKVAEYKVVYL